MRWQYPKGGDVFGILFVLVMLFLAAVRLNWFPYFQPNAGTSFSPDWDCTPVPTGEPICIKKLGR
jgi:hypothetical protein